MSRGNSKENLARYLRDPQKCIASAGGDESKSLDDLRFIAYNGNYTPQQHVDAALSMLFSHLSAGDQSNFNPAELLPPHLCRYETKAFLSMVGIFSIFNKYLSLEGLDIAPTTALTANWPHIRTWIHYFFYRAITREAKASPPSTPLAKTVDDVHLERLGEDWSIFAIILRILTFVQLDSDFFKTTVSKDGTSEIILKLWARLVRAAPLDTASTERVMFATMLLNDCLSTAKVSGTLEFARAQLLREVDGDAKAIAAFITAPLRDAAKLPVHEFSSRVQLLYPLMQLIHWLLEGIDGGEEDRPDLGRAFCDDPKTDPRPVITKIMRKYVAFCKDGNPPQFVRSIIKWSFQACRTLLFYPDAIDFTAKMLDGGLLEVYGGLVPSLRCFAYDELAPASFLLKEDISSFLLHEKVITAAKNALHRLEKERNLEYRALKETESGLKDAWRYFTCHAFERAILKGIYDAKYQKEDKLSCNFCRVRMNEKTLKKCSGCKIMFYCSPKCQTGDWNDHKFHCKSLTRNIEVYKLKADASHFIDHLMRSDVMRHLPGLNALADSNPRTHGGNVLLAYEADYIFSPPTFRVFPAADVADDSTCSPSMATDPDSQAIRRELVQRVRDAKGVARIVQLSIRGHAGTPVVTFHTIGPDIFFLAARSPHLPLTFNSSRVRAIDENSTVLAVQRDWTDVVMADAIFGRMLSCEEFDTYLAGNSAQLLSADQGKTVFERVDDAVRRRKDMNAAPCRRDQSGLFLQ